MARLLPRRRGSSDESTSRVPYLIVATRLKVADVEDAPIEKHDGVGPKSILLLRRQQPLRHVADNDQAPEVWHSFDRTPRIAEGPLPKGVLTCGYVVAGAGFEPATFGL